MGYPQPPSVPDHLNMESISKARVDNNGDAIVASYSAWLEKHPSALDSFDQITSLAHGKEMVVFLDYDGTLSPIVDDPEQAFMTDAMRSVVREVGKRFPTAIVSGRSRDKVFEFVKLNNLYYAGSHGMDISTPLGSLKYENHKHHTRAIDEKGNDVVNFRPAQEFLPKIQELKKVLQEITLNVEGAVVEDNKFCISVHFRHVNEEVVGILKEMVETTMESYEGFRISEGKSVCFSLMNLVRFATILPVQQPFNCGDYLYNMRLLTESFCPCVMEIRPTIDWDKGRALQYLLDNLGFDNSSDALPIYIGDDKTDEDAFKMIKRIGRGFSVVVSAAPKETKASYSLRDPTDVMSFLVRLGKWKGSI